MQGPSMGSSLDLTNGVGQQQGLVLPTPSMQNQIHELAKTLPPPRKQNTACDACRSRKVKCHRLPGQDKCQHCLSKNYPCTHYVQQATSEKKRHSTVARRPRNISSASPSSPSPGHNIAKIPSPTAESIPTSPHIQQSVPLTVKHGFYPPITLETPTRDVLAYLFSPPDNVHDPVPFGRVASPYAAWGELASQLEDEQFRAEFALDLVEVFFQIVHTRIPLLNPAQFRNSLRLKSSALHTHGNERALHPALAATVIAWGTKFSEHPLLVADRRRPGGQSLLSKAVIDRTRDLAEALKVHRIPSHDHVVIGLLIEPLQSQIADDPNGFLTFWLRSSIRHLLELGINHKSVTSTIQDPEQRGTMIFAWWMACICDAYGSVYYRYKPLLDDDDYDMDFYTVDPINPDIQGGDGPATPSPREQLEFLGYYRAAHSLARTARQMSRQLWKPAAEADGIPFQVAFGFSNAFIEWRDQYLNIVGVPSNFEGEWDFVTAVSSCASDATYHVMWIILFNALDEFGIKEVNDARLGNGSPMPDQIHIDGLKKKISDEALHGALRIAGLTGVLTSNGYLRLDTAVMHVSCIQAGNLLARLGRPEVSNCIAGLEQYSYSYEEAGDAANTMRSIYQQSLNGEIDFFNHMSSVAPKVGVMQDHSMNVDDQMHAVKPPPNFGMFV
ncbi:hypothetical protein C8J56DRAFT_911818 [Mycena floridula]|nr:hypothetical protein C8J56DRAFT_911818 [Mycena floridula]